MASKEQQVIKDLAVQNEEKENKKGKASKQSEEESHHLEEVENKKPGENVRRGRVRRLVPNFRWAIPNRHVDHNEGREDVGKFVGQVMEVKRKTREQQMRPYGRFQTPEPDNHYDFCLIP
ncbi:protein BEX4 [Onychomys torridus]|uniref:protein BEX4 n=1 Tax=Onychomys torridus TaxID=38674 RepID=UPI00167F9ADF|nr:protein BEX4 [Onychomys torridus]XP_036030797.1 protein BEX4 [Onychomys torridus]